MVNLVGANIFSVGVEGRISSRRGTFLGAAFPKYASKVAYVLSIGIYWESTTLDDLVR